MVQTVVLVVCPARQTTKTDHLPHVLSLPLAPSAEEQRLSDIYRRKGMAALIEELKKF